MVALPAWRRRRAVLLPLLPLLSLLACAPDGARPTAPGQGGSAVECTTDATCDVGQQCVSGACVAAPPEAACTFEADPACGAGQLCVAVPDAFCPGPEGCIVPTRCAPEVGASDGAFGCSADEECRSGQCWEGLCLRLCRDTADCAGGACLEIAVSPLLRGAFCLPIDEAGAIDPARPRCDSDGDCGEGQVCRRVSGDPYSPDSRAFCAPFDPTRAAAGASCAVGNRSVEGAGSARALAADTTCQHNACENACLSIIAVCERTRCTQPCRTNDDCPERRLCLAFDGPHEDPVVPVRSCWLPFGACLDERDCCPTLAPDGSCIDGWEAPPTHCGVVAQGGRLVTLCGVAPGSIAPGAPCDGDAACASGICLDEQPGAPGRCAFVCDPDLDRCPELTGAPTARCTRETISIDGLEGGIEVCR